MVLNEDRRSGIFSGRFTLTDEQVRELTAGRLYMDIHTTQFPGGEVRDQLLVGGRGIQTGEAGLGAGAAESPRLTTIGNSVPFHPSGV